MHYCEEFMSQDGLYDYLAHQDCDYQPDDTETVREMHERIQAEIKAEHAARSSKENTDMLLNAMGLKHES
jgi:hypothetical protein